MTPGRATDRRSRWGLHRAPGGNSKAREVDRAWRWPLLLALVATIPAFYAELLDVAPSLVPSLAYAIAAAVLATSTVHKGRAGGALADHLRHNLLDGLLTFGLLMAAVLPASSVSDPALVWRLAVAVLTLVRMVWTLRQYFSRGGVAYLMGVAVVVLLLCGAGFWWLEPRTPTFGDGLWLAFTTAATVGYGDVVPTTPASKIFSVFVVLLGFGVLTMVTAAIAASWVETEERRIEREILNDLRRQLDGMRAELQALRAETRAAARLLAERPPGS